MDDRLRKTTRQAQKAWTQPLLSPTGKLPPQALELETAVLGALMLEKDALTAVSDILKPGSFYKEAHQRIYTAIQELFDDSEPIDMLTVMQRLRAKGELELVGGAVYLQQLTHKVTSAANIEFHARVVTESAIKRELISMASQILAAAYEDTTDVFDLLDQTEKSLYEVSESNIRSNYEGMSSLMGKAIKELEEKSKKGDGLTGVPSGMQALDTITSGWQRSDLIIIAARPAMGKTAFILSAVRNAAVDEGRAIAVFSLEMSSIQLVNRLISSEAELESEKIKKGNLLDYEWQQLNHKIQRLSTAPIFIDDTPGLSIRELRTKCRRLKQRANIELIVIDYLQLMSGNASEKGSFGGNREQEIASISRALKGLAKELNVPVIALSQLSRKVEERPGDKRPQLSDLRESGCLTGDTLVTLADTGKRVPIRALTGQAGFRVWALDEVTQRLVAAPVARAFSTGVKPVYRLTTRLGRTIRATGNHKFLTIDGWKRLDELQTSDHLALPRRMALGAGTTLTGEQLALLGHLIGDGCTLPRHVVQYTTREEDLAHTVAALAVEVFGGAVAPRVQSERTWFQVYLVSTRRHTHGVRNAVAEWLDELEIWGRRSYEKQVPAVVFTQSEEGISRFLRHLWATDGCIRKVEGKSPRAAIYYASSSQRLAADVQSLLLRLGINARLKRLPQPGQGRDQYHVIVSGKTDVLAFADRVGAVGAYKQQALAVVRRFAESLTENTNRDVVPAAVWEKAVRPAMVAAGVSGRVLQENLGMAYCGTSLYRQNLSRLRMARVAESLDCAQLHTLAAGDVYWDQLTGIMAAGEEEVFDLTVPGPHNFVADDIIVHNSIEQDADMVMFLYRPEYYKIETYDDGEPTKNIGEVIIAKHRNGSLDTVKLGFIGKYTKFTDIANIHNYGGGGGGFGTDARALTSSFSTQSTFEQEAGAKPAPTTIRLGSKINNDSPFGKPLPPTDEAAPF